MGEILEAGPENRKGKRDTVGGMQFLTSLSWINHQGGLCFRKKGTGLLYTIIDPAPNRNRENAVEQSPDYQARCHSCSVSFHSCRKQPFRCEAHTKKSTSRKERRWTVSTSSLYSQLLIHWSLDHMPWLANGKLVPHPFSCPQQQLEMWTRSGAADDLAGVEPL